MKDTIFFRPLIPITIFLMVGIAVGTWFPGLAHWVLLITGFVLIPVVMGIVKRRTLFFVIGALFCALGYLSIQPWTSPSLPSNHIIYHATSHRWKISGIVDNDPIIWKKNRIQFVLNVHRLEKKSLSLDTTGRLRVTCRVDTKTYTPDFLPGDTIRFSGKIRKIRNFHNPGGFNYERFMAFKNIHVSSWASFEKLSVTRNPKVLGVGKTILQIRQKTAAFITETLGENPTSAVMKALVVGDRDGIDDKLRNDFNRSGMGHLLAISGLHVGIVATVFFILFSVLLSRVSVFLWNGWVRKAAALLTLFPVVTYGLLAGMSPSTQRAVIMVSVFLMTFLIGRKHDSINTLAVAALIILIIYPPALFSVSFQLSFSAVLAILSGFSSLTLSKKTGDIKNRMIMIFSGFFLSSLFAILGTFPLAMYYFNQISLVGLPVNFIVVPMVGFLVVPLGLISGFILPVSQILAGLGFEISGAVLSFSLEIIHYISELKFSAVKTITPSLTELILYYGMFLLVLHWRLCSKKKLLLVSTAIFLITCVDIAYWRFDRFNIDKLQITFIDVGQGNAALLEFPCGYIMMIDGGGFSDNSVFDVGERIVAPLLWRKKIKTVNTLVLTHPDADHLNGLLYIAENFNVNSVWTNHQSVDTMGYTRFMEIIRQKNIDCPSLDSILGVHQINGVSVNVMYPSLNYRNRAEREETDNTNNNSLVMKVQTGSISVLFTGDIMAPAEAELCQIRGHALKSTVLVAPHHGSRTSSTLKFLARVNPNAVVISAGWQNRFGMPADQVLQRYRKRKCQIFRTDVNGAIEFSTDGKSYSIESMLNSN